MKIGIIGVGIVGGAMKFGFEKLGHNVVCHDLSLGTKIEDVLTLDVSIVFLCLPTPLSDDGSCDTSIVESVLQEISDHGFYAPVVIKSTVRPGFTEDMRSMFPKLRLAHSAEFLRERCAISDFVENQNLLVVGTKNEYDGELIIAAHGHYPKNIAVMTSTESELLKYMNNTFGALRVTFANEFYEIVQSHRGNYNTIKQAFLKVTGLPDIYLDVNDNMRGYSSICWNKDVPAIQRVCKNRNIKSPLIDSITVANDNFKKTPFKGTRE